MHKIDKNNLNISKPIITGVITPESISAANLASSDILFYKMINSKIPDNATKQIISGQTPNFKYIINNKMEVLKITNKDFESFNDIVVEKQTNTINEDKETINEVKKTINEVNKTLENIIEKPIMKQPVMEVEEMAVKEFWEITKSFKWCNESDIVVPIAEFYNSIITKNYFRDIKKNNYDKAIKKVEQYIDIFIKIKVEYMDYYKEKCVNVDDKRMRNITANMIGLNIQICDEELFGWMLNSNEEISFEHVLNSIRTDLRPDYKYPTIDVMFDEYKQKQLIGNDDESDDESDEESNGDINDDPEKVYDDGSNDNESDDESNDEHNESEEEMSDYEEIDNHEVIEKAKVAKTFNEFYRKQKH